MNKNILMSKNINKLLLHFAIPGIISLLVNALYNIVDQIFIGNKIGYIGNSATTITFPFITVGLAIALILGNGGAAFFSIRLGQKKIKEAELSIYYVSFGLFIFSALYFILANIFLKDLLYFFGATSSNYSYSLDYARIVLIGLPFSIFSTGFVAIIRSDTSPRFAMYSLFVGAILNIILDKIFIFDLEMGIKGAAFATIISQIIVFFINIYYFRLFKMVKISFNSFFRSIINFKYRIFLNILSLGISSFIIQIAITFVQIVINNLLRIYGSMSKYGSDIPIASFGISMKVLYIFTAIIVGIGIGAQPILGYNFGSKNYKKVIEIYKLEIKYSTIISIIATILFVFFPKYILLIFGKETSPEYIEFSIKVFRIYLCTTFIVGFQINTSMFFIAIGKPVKSILLSLSRQVIFLLPFLYFYAILFQIDGLLFSAPSSDIISTIIAFILIKNELKSLRKEIRDESESS